MYGFSHDEKHLLFIDCFGLTRLSAPKKVKTDRKITGSDGGGIATVSRDGSLAGSYEDLWDKSVVWTFPELKSALRLDRFRAGGLVVHPEGSHYIYANGATLQLEPVDGKTVLLPLRLDAPPEDEDDDQPKSASFDLSSGGEKRPALVFGEGEGKPNIPAPLRIAHDGTLVRWDGRQLICATLRGTSLSVEWRRQLQTPANARVDLYADRERCLVCLHQGERYTLVILRGDKEERIEFESLATPAFAGPYLAYQPNLTQVRHRNLDSGEEQEYSLEVYAKKRKVDLPNTGVATLFCGAQGRLVALAGHRESLLDLVAGVELPRKLPAKQLELRQALLGHARGYANAARLAGARVELGRVEIDTKNNRVSITNAMRGPEALFGALIASHAYAIWNNPSLPDGWRMSSYGAHGSISAKGGAVGVAELVEGYTKLAKVAVSFASTLSFWADVFDPSRHGDPPSDPAVIAFLTRALVEAFVQGPSATLDYAGLVKRGAPTFDEVKAGLDAYVAHANDLPHNAGRLCGVLFNRLFEAEAAKLWAYCMFESPAYADGNRLSDFDYHAIRPLIERFPETVEIYRAWFAANTIPESHRRYALEQLRTHVSQ